MTSHPAAKILGEVLKRYIAERGLKLKHLAAGVAELSRMFTGRAAFDPGYMRRPGLRHAYATYYAPLGAMKLAAILGELGRIDPEFPARCRTVVDLGGGPGTGLLGLLLRDDGPLRYTLVDRVPECADEARVFLSLFDRTGNDQLNFARSAPREPVDLVLAMNVLGELEEPERAVAAAPRARYVVIVEPALKTSTQSLMERRDRWVGSGWKVAAPCPAVAACPMRASADLWCHAEVPISTIAIIDELDRRTGLRKESLKFSYMVLTREGRSLSEAFPGAARLVSNRHAEKGKFWGWVCGAGNSLERVELLRRARCEANRDFAIARRGDVFSPLKLDGKRRVSEATRILRMTLNR